MFVSKFFSKNRVYLRRRTHSEIPGNQLTGIVFHFVVLRCSYRVQFNIAAVSDLFYNGISSDTDKDQVEQISQQVGCESNLLLV